MTGGPLLIDTLLRGMIVGAQALIALGFVARRPVTLRRGLGAAFIVSTAAYIVNTSAPLIGAIGPLALPVHILSIIAPVIFWWFALSLFDDRFRMRWPVLVPLLFVSQLAFAFFLKAEGLYWTLALALARATMIAVFAHAMYTALRYLNDDLIEGRRRFRVIFAVAVAIVGFAINYQETLGYRDQPPPWLLLSQASSILIMTLGFGVWLLGMRPAVLDGEAPRTSPPAAADPQAMALKPADRPAYERLMRLMAEGVWREEGLTVPALAEKVGVPEHQLRQLINGQLGHRNFSAFLNAWRLPAAQALLADPDAARKQVLQIALEVGFGSIAPFNRAFKEATGETPTEYRRRRLGGP
ncbi:MAG: helix-turn-helix domain-containing protein [Parvularculaceae bacterium]|jgi:AraC-like DNA-binding protein|nr:helix-turn-helix domain-containing protein [Parvularculaceae bacterium]